MKARLFSAKPKKEKKTSPFITLHDLRDHLDLIIKQMKTSDIQPTDENDEKSARNQLNFSTELLITLDHLLSIPKTDINAKKSLAGKLNSMPKDYFGPEEMPAIVGQKSRSFALLLADHFFKFTQVKFSKIDTKASIIASKITSLNVRSIPEYSRHLIKISEQIKKNASEADFSIKP